MLPAIHRMRGSADFTAAVRGGRRAGSRRLVVHLQEPTSEPQQPALVGFVVSKAVGGAVQRNQVKRRLRHLMLERLSAVGAGARVVVRALPAARGASSAELAADLDRALNSAQRRRR